VEDPVAKHFCQKNHCVKNFKVIGIEKTGHGDKIYRETKESLWIKKMKNWCRRLFTLAVATLLYRVNFLIKYKCI
jgi:hypothetical protein